MGYYLIGDVAYPLKSCLMKPFLDNGPLTDQQHVYSNKTSRDRMVVKSVYGRLKGRWSCLLKWDDCNIQKVKTMVIARCVLYNIWEMYRNGYREEWGGIVLRAPVSVPYRPPLAFEKELYVAVPCSCACCMTAQLFSFIPLSASRNSLSLSILLLLG